MVMDDRDLYRRDGHRDHACRHDHVALRGDLDPQHDHDL